MESALRRRACFQSAIIIHLLSIRAVQCLRESLHIGASSINQITDSMLQMKSRESRFPAQATMQTDCHVVQTLSSCSVDSCGLKRSTAAVASKRNSYIQMRGRVRENETQEARTQAVQKAHHHLYCAFSLRSIRGFLRL